MNNKVIQIILIPVFLLLGMWAANYVVTLPVFFQIYAAAIGIVITILLLIGRDLAFDFKFLCLLMLGYAFGGKGFAYITPVEPFFISEVTIVLCLFGLVFRYFRGAGIFPTSLHLAIFLWMTVVALYLLADFPVYGVDAIKDSTIGYYGLYFLIAYAMFQSPAAVLAFGKVLKYAVFCGMIGGIVYASGVVDIILTEAPALARFYQPHPDSYIPLVTGAAIYGITQGTVRKSLPLIGIGVLGILVLMLSKTAGLFCFGCCFLMMIVAAKRVELLVSSILVGTLGAIVLVAMVAGGSKFVEDKILASDQVQTISEIGAASGEANDSTSDWRISWWRIITEDTIANNPVFGSGLGSDIAIHFIEETLDLHDSTEFARYPHNIMFNVLGRLGFLGLGLFLILYGMLLRFSYVFARTHFRRKDLDPAALLAFVIFFAGLVNSLVQATYETPFAAIPHWVCLGFLVAYHQRHKPPVYKYSALRTRGPEQAVAGPA